MPDKRIANYSYAGFIVLACLMIVSFFSSNLPLSSQATSAEPLIAEGATCLGTEIKVAYPTISPDTPFECLKYCSTRATEPHYILHSNGIGTQCGIRTCQDWGEDKCITCKVSEEIIHRYGLKNSNELPSCRKISSSSI